MQIMFSRPFSKIFIEAVHKLSHPLRGRRDLPKVDITPYAYLVNWVTKGREVTKISKNG